MRVRLLHGARPRHPQSHQPLHREWQRGGARQRADPLRARQPQRRHESQRRRALHFGPDGKLYVAVGENAFGPNAQIAQQRPGQDPAHQRRRHRSPPTIRSTTMTSGNNRAIWALGLRNPFTFAFHPAAPGGSSSTTSARAPGRRSTRAWPGRTTAGRSLKARRAIPAFSRLSTAIPTPTAVRDCRRRVLCAGHPALSSRLRQRLLLRRFLRGLDPEARSGGGLHRRAICDRHLVSGRSQGVCRRPPLLPCPRNRPGDRRCLSNRVRRRHARRDRGVRWQRFDHAGVMARRVWRRGRSAGHGGQHAAGVRAAECQRRLVVDVGGVHAGRPGAAAPHGSRSLRRHLVQRRHVRPQPQPDRWTAAPGGTLRGGFR